MFNTDVFEYCADVLQTIGYGVPTLSDGLDDEDYDLEAIKEEFEKNDSFKFELPDKVIEVEKGKTDNNIFNKPVWQFVSGIVALDGRKFSRDKFKDYNYGISSDGADYSDTPAIYSPTASANDYINCSIIDDKKVSCEVSDGFSGQSRTFSIKVTNPNNPSESAADSFTITLFDCSKLNGIQCGQQTSVCKWCVDTGKCYYRDGTDKDGDGFDAECDKDCDDNNKFVNLSSNNPYCDCNPSDGYTNGTEEKGSLLCSDSFDNNCDGTIDGCSKLKCTKLVVDNDCVAKFDYECSSKGWRDGDVDYNGCWYNFLDLGDVYDCWNDWETECMENPECAGGTPIGSPISCVAVCTPNCQYSGVCDEEAPDGCGGTCTRETDNTVCGSGQICQNGVCVSSAVCDLTNAYWEGGFIEVENWGGSYYDVASVQAGSEVTFTVKGSSGCSGKTVEFKAQECDLTGVDCNVFPYCGIKPDDIALTNPLTSVFTNSNCDSSGCTAETKWNAEWVLEINQDKEEGNNPEYLFNAEVAGGEDVMEMKGNHPKNPRFLRVIKAVASLSLEFTDIDYKFIDPYHYYYHTRIFRESNGVGVTLTNGELCYQSTGDCDSATVNYRIEGGNQLVQTDKKFYTPSSSDIFTLKYWGTDDNGNPIYIEQSLNHP